MRRTFNRLAAVVLLLEAARTVKAFANFATVVQTKDPENPFPGFDPAKMPEKVDIQLDEDTTAPKMLYHLLGSAWWAIKRDVANEKLRVHANYFHHETEVTQFKRELDEDD
jgi:hypothetical protein